MNQELLNTKLKNIFSKKISSKYKNYRFNYNEELIKKLIHNEKLKKIFDLTFSDCLEYFRGKKMELLDGIEKFDDIKNQISKKDGDEYLKLYDNILNNFEGYFNNKKKRNRTKKNEYFPVNNESKKP